MSTTCGEALNHSKSMKNKKQTENRKGEGQKKPNKTKQRQNGKSYLQNITKKSKD